MGELMVERRKKSILAVSRKEHTPNKNGCGTGEHRKTKPGPGFKLGYSKSGDLLTAISEPARCSCIQKQAAKLSPRLKSWRVRSLQQWTTGRNSSQAATVLT